MKDFFHDTFSSLKIRNFRLYFIGQTVSVTGTFMQAVAQSWLVLKLTHSGTALGLVTAMQFLPILVFGPWGGAIADRFDKRRILYITQTLFAIQALLLGTLVLTGLVQVWMIAGLAFMYGLVNLIDNPARQTFVPEMVGNEKLRNAVTLYSSLVNLARVLGPTVAAVLIAKVGLGMCFIYNGISYTAILVLLALMKKGDLNEAPRTKKVRGQVLEGLRYIIGNPVLRNTLVMMAVIGTLTYEFQVTLPILAQFTFHGNADTYALLVCAQGIGSIIGGILLAGQKKASVRGLILAAFLFGIATLFSSVMPNLILTALSISVTGFFSILFLSLGNTILQLECEPRMRGRVMSYWTMAFLGSTAVGGPIVGWIGQTFNPRWGLGVGGIAAVVTAAAAYLLLTNLRGSRTTAVINADELSRDESRK